MKKGIGFLALVMLVMPQFAGAQNQISLPALSKIRSEYSLRQKRLAEAYAKTNHRPLSFFDGRGNLVRLIGLTPEGHPIYFTTLNAEAAITTQVVQLRAGGSSGLDLLGAGMVVGIWDGGIVKDHIELGTRVIGKEGGDISSHATHVAGTVIATGLNPSAKGMVPLANALSYDFDDDEAEMAALAGPNATSLLFSNHSYGTVTGWLKTGSTWEWTGNPSINSIEDYRFGFYDERAQHIDEIASLAPYYSIVWAAGNDRADYGNGSRPADCNGGSGYDCIIPEAVAKNILTVGAVEKILSYTNPFDVVMSFFSSWGPTDDGRIKPDLVGAGVNLFSLTATGDNTYGTASGTSMATPNVSGSIMAIQELYQKLHGGEKMKAATVKALAIHTAREAGSFPGPDYSFGWGLMDASRAAGVLVGEDGHNNFVKELTLKNDSVFTMILHPRANKKIIATIVWTDPPAIPLTPVLDPIQSMLINDLDLRISDDGGIEVLPWTLDPSNPSLQASRGDNFRDNVEKLEFDLPEGKDYTLVVRHKGTLKGGKQDFSLIVSYESTYLGKTFYWVGDTGNWNDGAHWSASSGGVPTMLVPGAADAVVVDENSFDAVGVNVISLTGNAVCNSMLWLDSKPSDLSMNNAILTIGSYCTFASAAASASTPGTIHLSGSAGVGTLHTHNTILPQIGFVFDGDWSVKGELTARHFIFGSGHLTISDSQIRLDSLNSASGLQRLLSLNNSTIRVKRKSVIEGDGLTIHDSNSQLIADTGGTPFFDWSFVQYPGTIVVKTIFSMQGDNSIAKVAGSGAMYFLGNSNVDSLLLEPGAIVDIAPDKVLTIGTGSQLSGQSVRTGIQSSGTASLFLPNHALLCVDNILIHSVNLTGLSVVTLGSNSVVEVSTGWIMEPCDEILFADFDYRYNCTKGLTEFTNTSLGNINSYTWEFSDSPIVSHEINPFKSFAEPGIYSVTLTATGPSGTNSYTTTVDVVANALSPNQIVVGGGSVTSVETSSAYQWFKDGLALPGATSRSYPLDEGSGVYFLLSYDGGCNALSDTLTILSVAEKSDEFTVYPNPASDDLFVTYPAAGVAHVALKDILGRNVFSVKGGNTSTTIPVSNLIDGVYILEFTSESRRERRRVILRH